LTISSAIINFKSTVLTEKTKVVAEPPIILIFGGLSNVVDAIPKSCRAVFVNAVQSDPLANHYSFQMPEYYEEEWNKSEGHGNLVDFEVDAASLSSQIIVFLESAGSICELGLLSGHREFRDKLFLVLSDTHYHSPSFIVNGPIKLINEDSVYVSGDYEANSAPSFKLEVKDVINALSHKLNKPSLNLNSQKFNGAFLRHQFLLLIDLINLFYFLTFDQVLDLFEFSEIEISPERLRVMLYQLTIFNFIESKKIKTNTYFFSLSISNSFIDYTGTNDKTFDKTAFRVKLTQLITQDVSLKLAFEHFQKVVKVE